ncbi:MAG: hypothetical protein MI919_04910, partial [Holophagales bacterium]|nr:hypothetical protein [Holophagales bacterium]
MPGILEEGGELKFTITYEREVGTLIINVVNGSDPDYTLPGTAGWTLIDTPDDYPSPPKPTDGDATGLNDPEAPTGVYTVVGKDIDHWRYEVTANIQEQDVAPSDQFKTRTLDEGGQVTFTVTYFRDTGFLRIVTETFDGRNLPVGAGWEITHDDPGDYIGIPSLMYNAGESSPQSHTEAPAATGTYTVTGKPVTGWTFDVTVSSDFQEEVTPSGQTETAELFRFNEENPLIFTVTYTINRYELDAIYWDPVDGVQIPGGTITPGGAGVEHGDSQNFTATTLPTNYELLGTASFTGTSDGASVAGNVATVSNIQSNGTARIDVKLSLGELEVIILPESIRPQAGWRFQGPG